MKHSKQHPPFGIGFSGDALVKLVWVWVSVHKVLHFAHPLVGLAVSADDDPGAWMLGGHAQSDDEGGA